jgi:hypothetical protein
MSTIFFIDDIVFIVMCFAAFTQVICIDADYYASIKAPIKDKFEANSQELPIEKERV